MYNSFSFYLTFYFLIEGLGLSKSYFEIRKNPLVMHHYSQHLSKKLAFLLETTFYQLVVNKHKVLFLYNRLLNIISFILVIINWFTMDLDVFFIPAVIFFPNWISHIVQKGNFFQTQLISLFITHRKDSLMPIFKFLHT